MDKQYNLKTVEKIMQYQSYAEKLNTFAEYLIFKLTHKKQRVMCIECINTTNDIITYTVETHYNEYVITINTHIMTGYANFA